MVSIMTPQNCNATSRLDPEQAQIPLKMKKSSSAGLFRLFSKGITSEPKHDSFSSQQENQKPSVTAELRGMGLEVVPCNYIRPRGLKLEPRKESTSTPRNSTYRSHRPPPIVTTSDVSLPNNERNQSILPATKEKSELVLRRASNNTFPNGHLAVDPQLANKLCSGSALKSPNSPLMSPVSLIHETGLPAFASLRVQFVVGRIAMDFGSSTQWTDWLNSYSNGEFNIQNPPAPPPLSPTFSHLPAAYPRYEERRCICSKKYDLVWRKSMQERVGIHVRAALKKFGTRYGSMSFFDEEYELFIAENGYNVSRIQRSNSIAAHALYSTEVLSVIDTQKDWRFQSSPITIGKPFIKFFAAAPLVTSEGDIIGVLSIFSRSPRKSFSHDERRQLAECSAALMADISTQLDNPKRIQSIRMSQSSILPEISRNSNVNTTSIQQVKPLIKQDSLNQTTAGESSIDANVILTKRHEKKKTNSTALRYHQIDSQENLTGLIFSARQMQGCSQVPGEQTPPSSAKSNSGLGFEAIRTTDTKCEPRTSYKREYGVRNDSISSTNAAIAPHNSCGAHLSSEPSESAPHENEDSSSAGIGSSLGESHPIMSLIPHAPIISDPVSNFIPSTHDKTTLSDLRLRNFTHSVSPYTTPSHATAYDSTTNIFHRPDSSPQSKNEVSVEDFMLLSDGDITELSEDLVPVESKLTEVNGNYSMPISCVNVGFNFQKESTGGSTSYPYQNRGKEIWFSENISPVNSQTDCKDVTRTNENRLSWKFPRPRTDTIETYCTGSSIPTSGDENCSPKSSSSPACYPPISHDYDQSDQKISSCETGKTKVDSIQSETLEAASSKKDCQAVSNISQLPFDEISRRHPSPSLHNSRCPSLSLSMNSVAVHKRPTQEAVSQSAISLASHCKLMGYSLMYIAKVYPYRNTRQNKNELEANAQKLDDIKVQLLTAHGLTDTIQLCPLIHLRVLRSRGPTTWEDQSEHNEFKKGILIVIKSEGGPLRKRSRGLILGAFREAQTSSDLKPQDTAIEIKALVDLAQNLKLILTTPSSSRSSQISNVSPDPSAWLPTDKVQSPCIV